MKYLLGNGGEDPLGRVQYETYSSRGGDRDARRHRLAEEEKTNRIERETRTYRNQDRQTDTKEEKKGKNASI